jgi:hypothetical protein
MRILAAIMLALAIPAAQAQKPDAAAEELRTETVFWESVRNSTDPADFRAYLEQYPNGRFAPLARNRLNALGSKPAAPAAAQPAATSSSRLPREGDTWTYRLTERRSAPREYVAKVASTTSTSITEQFSLDGKAGTRTHKGERELMLLGTAQFAPYLFAFGDLAPMTRFGRILVAEAVCGGGFICEATAWVAARETVRTPAGTFDAVRVDVDHSWRPTSLGGPTGAQTYGSRQLSVWYANEAKRAVKITSRPARGVPTSPEIDFELELVSYRVQ